MDALDGLDTGLVRRQGLAVIESLLGANPMTSSTQATTSAAGLSGLVGAITSIIPPIISLPLGSSTTPTSTHSSSSSTGSTSSSATPSKIASTTSSISTSLIPSTSASSTPSTLASTPAVTPTVTASPVVYTSSDGTSIVYVTSYVSNSTASPTSAPPETFLQNKPLEGGVFALVGIVVLVIIFVIITFTIRRRRRNRMENEIADAITFDPSVTEHYIDEESRMSAIEKYGFSGSSSGHGHSFGHTPNLAYASPMPAQYDYHGQGYEQQAAYRVPQPQAPIYNQDNAVNTGGANLTRKYSDRKPVPPLLPNPVYDPSHSPVLPSHFHSLEDSSPPIPRSSSPSAPAANEATPALPDHFGEDDYCGDDPYTGVLQAC
ncbi:hypothetical protein K503DRAFT_796783 [Rhizopogon vinicolor AM-OR11-026]|uniref:Uncharacterized protein n=1 Tax=Rhizopogon vinicolor AM-OR11-026 TaxID=1314800 RepID=A0A1B7NDI7_9AGAM|nr:hypothetical protein K503DRAFT_796783 [Rhizopogon vinicolor AM-OR11-026]